VGEVENGAYGHTLGGGVGLASVELEDNITDDFINSGRWELDIVGTRYPVTVSLTPLYDPKRVRIKA
ncbi:MAG: glycine cleavage T C-terminal barrel domain-containing protein, partial [Actinomycetota bacterium]